MKENNLLLHALLVDPIISIGEPLELVMVLTPEVLPDFSKTP